jgi:putative hydrolase of the HAD superfamily
MANYYSNLRSKGIKLVLLSDQSKEWWPYLDEKLKISQNFDVVIVSSFIGLHKPNPDIYKYALDKSQSLAEECIFVDDIDYNLTPAKELGMSVILYESSDQAISEFSKFGLIPNQAL